MQSVQVGFWVVFALVALALVFDFMNGFHDAANSIATVVSTGVLKPAHAVLFAAFFNFIAIFIFHLSVAATVGKGIVQPGVVDTHVVFGALVGAITWNVLTWYYGIPSSSSHALIGGIVGAVIAKAGSGALVSAGILKTVAFIFVSPMLGFLLGSLMMLLVAWVFRRTTPSRVDKWFRRLQLVSAGAYSLGHGGNDAQKTIGIIWLLLITAGASTTDLKTLPMWVVYACYGAIAWGTYLGGWRIVKTMGTKITRLNSVSGSCASMGGAISLGLATLEAVEVLEEGDDELAGQAGEGLEGLDVEGAVGLEVGAGVLEEGLVVFAGEGELGGDADDRAGALEGAEGLEGRALAEADLLLDLAQGRRGDAGAAEQVEHGLDLGREAGVGGGGGGAGEEVAVGAQQAAGDGVGDRGGGDVGGDTAGQAADGGSATEAGL